MSIFPTKILLATDGSKEAHFAAPTAIDLTDKTGSELHVTFVLRTQDAPYTSDYDAVNFDIQEAYQEVKQMGKRLLEEQVRWVEEAGGTVAGAHFRIASADEGIVAVGEDIGAGLIVMGSRGLGGIRRALMGSVSDSVVRHAHCPVMVVREKPVVFPTKILVATDGSAEATLAAKSAADLASKSGSELHVLTVAPDIREFDQLIGKRPVGSYAETHKAIEKETRRILEEQAKQIRDAGGTVEEIHLEMGEPPDRAIVYLGEYIDAGLIVMGSRGHGEMRRALMGSVSDSVVRHAHCPVMVVRPEKKDGARREEQAS